MKNILNLQKLYIIVSVFVLIKFITVYANGNHVPEIGARCELDNLDVNNSKLRLKWALQCRYISKSMYNRALTIKKFENGVLKIHNVSNPLYPTFGKLNGTIVTNPRNYVAYPKGSNKDINICDLPEDYTIVGWCRASCFIPEEKILFNEGYMPLKKAYDLRNDKVIGLNSRSTLDNPMFSKYDVGLYTASLVDTQHDIIKFKMASGGELNVTTNHPMLNSNGVMVNAESLQVGDSIPRVDGALDIIVEKSMYKYFGKVYNLAPKTYDLYANILVAQGYLVGSTWYQNEGANMLNRLIFRQRINTDLTE